MTTENETDYKAGQDNVDGTVGLGGKGAKPDYGYVAMQFSARHWS